VRSEATSGRGEERSGEWKRRGAKRRAEGSYGIGKLSGFCAVVSLTARPCSFLRIIHGSMFHNSDIPTFGTASGTSSVASVPTPNLLPVEKTLGNQGQEQKDIDMPEDDGGVQKLADEFHAAIVSPRMLNSVPESAFAKASDEAGGITKVDPPQCVEDDDEVAKTISETIARQVTPPTPPKPPSPALSSPPRSTAVSVDTDVLSPDTLRGKTPEGVNPAKKEERLSDETFEEIFGCTKIEFNKKAKWRQVQDKKKHGFF